LLGRDGWIKIAQDREATSSTKGKKVKVKIKVEIENTDGTSAVEPTTIDVDIPDFEDFTGPDTFGAVFDKYERKVLKARNKAIEAATEKYLSEMAKKNTV
jgi:hypothetical protein